MRSVVKRRRISVGTYVACNICLQLLSNCSLQLVTATSTSGAASLTTSNNSQQQHQIQGSLNELEIFSRQQLHAPRQDDQQIDDLLHQALTRTAWEACSAPCKKGTKPNLHKVQQQHKEAADLGATDVTESSSKLVRQQQRRLHQSGLELSDEAAAAPFSGSPESQSTDRRRKKRRPRQPIPGADLGSAQPEARMSAVVSSVDAYDEDEDEDVTPERVHETALDQQSSASFSRVAEEARGDNGTAALEQAGKLKVCILSADFWGLKAAGGTATAYHLLAGVLAGSQNLKVTFLGVTKKLSLCEDARAVNSKAGVEFACLQPLHFSPEVVETYPYERLSHAVLAWLLDNRERCDVVHGHEWGGAFLDTITALHFRQVKPGMRMAVQPHGGHFWSTQGQVQRPMDVVSLRIDNAERMAHQLNDAEISPTNYMTAFLRQRGWKLPADTITIPNVIPEVEPAAAAAMGQEKKIWRLAFFSRLEERKGIKLFVDAVSAINTSSVQDFEVYFVGTEAKIDMRPSSVWLREQTARWPWKTHLKVGASRDEALEILSREGMLLVLCSLIDNMPYVVAEAAVKGIPFVVFDVGGTLEMFDGKSHRNNVVQDPTLEALTSKLSQVLSRGSISTIRLSDAVTNGRHRWLQWHAEFAKKLPGYVEEDRQLLASLQTGEGGAADLHVVQLLAHQHALELWEPLCKDKQPSKAPLLLLPPEFEFLDAQSGPHELQNLAKIGAQRGNRLGALAFGAVLPEGSHSFPTSPTWMLYAGDDTHCIQDVPLLLSAADFCSAFLAEARVFRHYHTWVMAMLLHQQDLQVHTFPHPMFKVLNFTGHGYSCMPDKVPIDRDLTFPVASNLYRDAEELLRNLHLAPFSKPMVSLIDDFPVQQRHKGWQFGYLKDQASLSNVSLLSWHHADTGLIRDGKWSCRATQFEYPNMHHSLLHPCASSEAKCCDDSAYSAFLLRYESFFHSRQALLVLAYEVWPACGDGLDFIVRFTPAAPRKPQTLLKRGYEPDPKGQPNRQKIEWRLHIRTGDVIDFIVDPRSNHDCDGLYIVDVSIWTDAAVVSTAS